MKGVINEMGFYDNPEKVGWVAWIRTIMGNYFVGLEGQIVGPFGPEVQK